MRSWVCHRRDVHLIAAGLMTPLPRMQDCGGAKWIPPQTGGHQPHVHDKLSVLFPAP